MLKSIYNYLMNFADKGRRFVFNGIFLFLVALIGISFVSNIFKSIFSSPIEKNTALVINFSGQIVEESHTDPREIFRDQLSGQNQEHMELREIIRAIESAKEDKKIQRLVLNLNNLEGAGLSTLRTIGAAIEDFKTSEKEVIARATAYSQSRYYLAAHAHEIYTDPLGGAFFRGFGRYRQYYRDAFKRLGINVHLTKTGDYKNFAEVFVEQEPSEATKKVDRELYGDLWEVYIADVEKARGFESGALTSMINNLLGDLERMGYDYAQLALEQNLVTGLVTEQEFRNLMIKKGVEDKDKKTFRQITLGSYLKTLPAAPQSGDIAIVIAEGGISDGSVPVGKGIGGDSTAALIRKARQDDKVKAIVLRVNSPGGSAFASEVVRREMVLAQEEGKPVIISMGDVAASGGYWISMAADEIWADATTITGSIGVVGMMMTAEELMKKLSLSVHGSSTTWVGEIMPDTRRSLDERFKKIQQGAIEKIYDDFLNLVANAREKSVDDIKKVAEGRVWTGRQALEHGLVDQLGGLKDAVARARELAELSDKSRAFYVRADRSNFEKFVASFEMNLFSLFPLELSLMNNYKNLMAPELSWFWNKAIERFMTQSSDLLVEPMAHCFCEDATSF